MATMLSKETAVTLSLGTILAAGGAVVGGVLWVQTLVNDLQASQDGLGRLQDRVAALEADTGTALRPRLASLERELTISRCREDELKDILDGVVSTLDQLTIIIETGGGEAAYTRSVPQLRSLIRRLETWKCT